MAYQQSRDFRADDCRRVVFLQIGERREGPRLRVVRMIVGEL
jgi:hypothetical protein